MSKPQPSLKKSEKFKNACRSTLLPDCLVRCLRLFYQFVSWKGPSSVPDYVGFVDRAALCCERQGRWKEAAEWHAHEQNSERSYDVAIAILEKHFDEANDEALNLRTDIVERAVGKARSSGDEVIAFQETSYSINLLRDFESPAKKGDVQQATGKE